MSLWTDATLKPIRAADGYTDADGNYYPPGWSKASIPGLVSVVPADRPDETPALIVSGTALGGVEVALVDGAEWHIEMVAGTPTQVWHTVARPAPTPEQITAAMLTHLAERRWQAEVGGTIWNGWVLPTDERSQQKYAAEALAVQIGSRSDGSPWKFAHGFEALSNAQVTAMATAARAHVLACYAKEEDLTVLITSGQVTTFAAIDQAFAAAFPDQG